MPGGFDPLQSSAALRTGKLTRALVQAYRWAQANPGQIVGVASPEGMAMIHFEPAKPRPPVNLPNRGVSR